MNIKFLLILLFSGLSLLVQAQIKNTDTSINNTDTIINNNLAPVTVHTSKYIADSMQNREDYADIFDYKKKKINMGDNKWTRTTVSMGKRIALKPQDNLSLLDIDALVRNIHSKKDKQKLALQKRLIQQEEDDYVLKIFTPVLVKRFSNMSNDDSIYIFIAKYAPSFTDIQTMNELDLGDYIYKHMKLFRQPNPPIDSLKND